MIFAMILFQAAVTISSDGLWHFMRPPSNGFRYPSSVSSVHTFGSSDRTNASHRITREDVASVETLFEAYFERAFFASEGLSNNWDVAAYGPRAMTDQSLCDVSFAASNGGERVTFEYAPASREMPGTLRFADTNLVNVWDGMVLNLLRRGAGEAKLLDRGPTWGDHTSLPDRRVWWSSSILPFAEFPGEFDWTEGPWPDGHSFVSNFVPVCAFQPGDGSDRGFPWYPDISNTVHFADELFSWNEVLRDTASYRSALGVDRLGQADYRFVTNTLPDVLSSAFGYPPDDAYGGYVARLVPDEYVDVSASEQTSGSWFGYGLAPDSVSVMEAWKPWIGVDTGEPETTTWAQAIMDPESRRYSVSGDDARFGVETAASGTLHDFYAYGGPVVSVVSTDAAGWGADYADPYFGYDLGGFAVQTDSSGVGTNGWWEYIGPSEGSEMAYYKTEVVTNFVTTNVSYLATTSRILAVHDRTMELPVLDLDGCQFVSQRVVRCEKRAEGRYEMSASLYMDFEQGTFRLDPTVVVGDLSYAVGERTNSTDVSYEWQDSRYDCAYLRCPKPHAGLTVSGRRVVGPITWDLKAEDILYPSADGEYSGVLVVRYDSGDQSVYYGVSPMYSAVVTGVVARCIRETGFDATLPLIVMYSCHAEAEARKTEFVGSDIAASFGKCFPAYTPGFRGAGRVRSVRCLFPSSVDYDIYDDPYYPPFVGVPRDRWKTEYRFSAPEFSSWLSRSTFPAAYATARENVRKRTVDGVGVPATDVGLMGILRVEPGDYDIAAVRTAVPGGLIDFRAYISNYNDDPSDFGVTVDFRDGRGRAFKFPGSSDPTREYEKLTVYFSFNFGTFVEEVAAPTFDIPQSCSATGRTSAGIVADWDFHALRPSASAR